MLEFGKQSSGSSDNIIVQKVKIADVEITYGTKQDWQKYADDIGINLTLDVGQSFQPKMYIGGSFKIDEVNNSVSGWGRAFKVKMLFDAIGLPIKLAKGSAVVDNRLPENAKNHIIGKEFARLSYKSTGVKADGDNRWVDWQDTEKLGNENILKDKFKKSVSEGYVKNFLEPNGKEEDSWQEKQVSDGLNGVPL